MFQATATAEKFTWRQAPDLMERLTSAQNALKAPVDIMTFAGFCDSREELERHVERYEQQIAAERAQARITALASADRIYDNLGSSVKRALGFERRVTDRNPARVITETRIALREARKLVATLERAAASLPEIA